MDVKDDRDDARGSGNPGASDASSAPPDAARRRLLKAGLSAAPIILTVRSRPAWAQAGNYPSMDGSDGSGNVFPAGPQPLGTQTTGTTTGTTTTEETNKEKKEKKPK
jgi:hypothetical protein